MTKTKAQLEKELAETRKQVGELSRGLRVADHDVAIDSRGQWRSHDPTGNSAFPIVRVLVMAP